MITNLLFDFSRVLLFAEDKNYVGLMNDLYRQVIKNKDYNFLDYFKFNQELLNFLIPFKDKYTLSLYTTDIIQDDPVAKEILAPIFKNIFAANSLGISKKDPNGYLVIAEKLNAKPEEILFIDDGKKNIVAAKKAGIKTIQYLSNEQLFKDLLKLDF